MTEIQKGDPISSPIEVIDNNDDDEDDMANLFSFGSSDALESNDDDGAIATPSLTTTDKSDERETDSPDSFLEMLNNETNNSTMLLQSSSSLDNSGRCFSGSGQHPLHDKETQDLLNWLDKDDTTEEIVFEMPTTFEEMQELSAATTECKVQTGGGAMIVALPPTFATLEEALASDESTVEQIRELFSKKRSSEKCWVLDRNQRVELYCRMVCHKSLEATIGSSLADSFEQWKARQTEVLESDDVYAILIRKQELGQRIAQQTNRGVAECEVDLIDLVHYQMHQKKSVSVHNDGDEESQQTENDILLPAVAAVLLSTGIPVSGAAVLFSKLIPNFMPLFALPLESEQLEAALALHTELYLLACYHIPLLVFHLDRYVPGWYWPKHSNPILVEDMSVVSIARNLKQQGQIPPSWLLSLLSGEIGGTMLPMETLLIQWDGILTEHNNASPFFLALAVLEQYASSLILMTGLDLTTALQKIWMLEDVDSHKESDDQDWIYEWWPKACALQASTPESVMDRLKRVEDEAIQLVLVKRQERKEAALRARLEAEAEAHREAQERKAEAARKRLSRARLVAFYRKHAPEKESNIDKIMETYEDKLDVLDLKLKMKYKEGFNPALKPKSSSSNKHVPKVTQGKGRPKSKQNDEDQIALAKERKPDKVSVMVTAAEVLPVLCWSKEAKAARGHSHIRRKRNKHVKHLKFYLVDSRSEEAAREQGRFPTAVSLSPEAMMDPERLKENEEMFESLRGAVHIVIMGEGFNALPRLYNQKLSPKLEELMQQDESRTNLCALFFHKLGLPFISVLDGGFAAAHSWLVREGPSHMLDVAAVLVDYKADNSLFGQLETLHNASATEKAQRKMANLLESSMVAMTKHAQHLERLAADLDTQKTGFKIPFAASSNKGSSVPLDQMENTLELSMKDEIPNTTPTQEKDENFEKANTTIDTESSATNTESTTNQPKEDVVNRLKGFGAAFNNTVKQNPWARFGGVPVDSGPQVGIQGFNRFRKSTMSRFTRPSSKQEEATNLEESFETDSPASSTNSNTKEKDIRSV